MVEEVFLIDFSVIDVADLSELSPFSCHFHFLSRFRKLYTSPSVFNLFWLLLFSELLDFFGKVSFDPF